MEDSQYWIKGMLSKSSQCRVVGRHSSNDILWLQAEFLPTQKPLEAYIFLPETTEGIKPPAVRLRSLDYHSLPERVGKGYVNAEVTFCLVDTVHTQSQAS